MKIKFNGHNNRIFKDCTKGSVYEAKMQHEGDYDANGYPVAYNDQVGFYDDVGDLVCQHITLIKEGFTILEEQ